MEMEIRVVAAADIGSYIGLDEEGGFYVLTLNDTKDIELADLLLGRLQGHGTHSTVRNVMTGEDVEICLESWDCPLDFAINMLLSMMAGRRCSIAAGSKQFRADAPNVGVLLRNEILQSEQEEAKAQCFAGSIFGATGVMRTLSIRWRSMSTTSKRRPSASTYWPSSGMRPS